MSDLQPKPTKITLGGKEYGLLFTINVIDAVQDKFDIAISQLADLMRDDRKTFKVLRFLLAEMINEAIDDAGNGEKHVDERAVGRKITPANMGDLSEAVLTAFTSSAPANNDEDISPNVISEQQIS